MLDLHLFRCNVIIVAQKYCNTFNVEIAFLGLWYEHVEKVGFLEGSRCLFRSTIRGADDQSKLVQSVHGGMIDGEIHFYVASTTFTVIVANASDFEDAFARTNTVPADTEFVEVFKSFYTMHCQSWSFGF